MIVSLSYSHCFSYWALAVFKNLLLLSHTVKCKQRYSTKHC